MTAHLALLVLLATEFSLFAQFNRVWGAQLQNRHGPTGKDELAELQHAWHDLIRWSVAVGEGLDVDNDFFPHFHTSL